MHSRALWVGVGLWAGLGVLVAATSAGAGTKGGMYDMNAMLNEGHPFAAPSHGLAPTTLPPRYGMTPIAPPPPTLRYTPPPRPAYQAAASGSEPWRPFGDAMNNDWFSRFYLSAGGGLHLLNDLDGSSTAGATYSIESSPGFLAQAALGTNLGLDFRVEGEVAYRTADYDQATAGGTTVKTANDLKIATGMANLLYDVRLGSPFVPYVGAGLGVAQLKSSNTAIGAVVATGKDATEFAYQGIVGVTYEYDRAWNIGMDARYLGTSDEDVSATAITLYVRYNM
ncbi:MAG: porin family protein [Alphaproteobacteria bacterium]|nr:porin family protein [Alphaproteobacteria bacterium]